MNCEDEIAMKKAPSITFRFLRAVTITIISIVSFICAVVGFQLYEKRRKTFDEVTAQQFFNIKKSIDLFIRNGKNVVDMLSETPAVRNADATIYNYTAEARQSGKTYTHDGKVEQAIATQFRLLKKNYSEFQEIYMGTKWGGLVGLTDAQVPKGFDPRGRTWYKDAAAADGNIIITEAYRSAADEVLLFSISRSVKTASGDFVGCIGLDIALSDLTSFIGNVRVGKTGYCMLLQNDGLILADPMYPQFNFKNVNETQVSAFMEIEALEDGSVLVDFDGKKCQAYVFPLSELGWKLVIIVEQNEIFSIFYTLVRSMILIGLLMFVIYFTIAILFARHLKRFFKRLETVLGKIAEGDLTDRVEVKRNDEIGSLMTHLNTAIEHSHTMICVLRDEADKMGAVGSDLSSNMEETAASIRQIGANVISVKRKVPRSGGLRYRNGFRRRTDQRKSESPRLQHRFAGRTHQAVFRRYNAHGGKYRPYQRHAHAKQRFDQRSVRQNKNRKRRSEDGERSRQADCRTIRVASRSERNHPKYCKSNEPLGNERGHRSRSCGRSG